MPLNGASGIDFGESIASGTYFDCFAVDNSLCNISSGRYLFTLYFRNVFKNEVIVTLKRFIPRIISCNDNIRYEYLE